MGQFSRVLLAIDKIHTLSETESDVCVLIVGGDGGKGGWREYVHVLQECPRLEWWNLKNVIMQNIFSEDMRVPKATFICKHHTRRSIKHLLAKGQRTDPPGDELPSNLDMYT